MKLIPNWRAVLVRAWSLRLMGLAVGLTGLEVLLPYIEPLAFVPPGWFGLLSVITTAGAFASRLVAQRNIK